MILSSFLGIFILNNIIATELQIIISIFAVEKKKRTDHKVILKEKNKIKTRKDI